MAVCVRIISRAANPVTRAFAVNSRLLASSFFFEAVALERSIKRFLSIGKLSLD